MPLNPIPGDNNNNNLFGTALGDLITGLGGNDAMNGNLGDDRLFGGSGDDYAFGNEGDDTLYGGAGKDVVSGGEGNDLSYGGNGDDAIIAAGGNDTMYGGTGNDDIFGGFSTSGGTQLMFGGDGDDLLRFNIGQSGVADGGTGTDTVSVYWYDTSAPTMAVVISLTGPLAGAVSGGNIIAFNGMERLIASTIGGDDTVVGGDLADEIYVHLGANTVLGLGGDDRIGYLTSVANIIDAGDGIDTLRISSAHQGPTLLVVNGSSATDGFGSTLLNVENYEVDGSFLNDVALFGSGDDLLSGNRGNDRADGNSGSDTLKGGTGNDLLNGGDDQDVLKGGDDDDALDGGDGDDTLDGGAGTDLLIGGLGADTFRLTQADTSQTSIADFTSGTDRLAIEIGKTGAAINTRGQLDPTQFNVGAAVGGFAQFVWVDDIGPLSHLVFDANGDGAGGEQTFCRFIGPVALTAADIFMI